MAGTSGQKYNYDVLAVGAHPDDIEHSIGGTLLHLARQGKKICLLHMCHGEAGTYGDRDTRDREAKAAADCIGADVRWLEFEDTKIEDSYEARLRMVRVFREVRPRVVMCQYYEFPLMHHDHEATGRIVRNSFRLSRFKNVDTGQDPFWVPNILYYLFPQHVRPAFVVDITRYFDDWVKLSNTYGSQLDAIPGYKDRLVSAKRAAGALIDVVYGEAFYCDRPLKGAEIDFISA